jgi:protein-S-isoprenylcysteine O-methyltransferase Ste14
MVTALRILIFLAIASVICQILLQGSRFRTGVLGKPPIAWPAVALAKAAMSVSILLMVIKAVEGNVLLSPASASVFILLLAAGTVILVAAFPRLGQNLRMGLPKDETILVTSGVYAISRNPMYLALFCLMTASLIYAFSWVNLISASLATVFHHRIVLAEEEYLARRFPDYESYWRAVRRYI